MTRPKPPELHKPRGGRREGAGRPKGVVLAPESEVVAVRVPVAIAAALDERAAAAGQSRTEFVRDLLTRAAKRSA